jgi:hypothetical protein
MDLEESIDEMKRSDCGFCNLLAIATPAPTRLDENDTSISEHCHVRAFSTNRTFAGQNWKRFLGEDSTMIGVVRISQALAKNGKEDALSKMLKSLDETGYIAIQAQPNNSFGVRKICSDTFDDDFAKYCISYCLNNHGLACNTLKDPASASSEYFVSFFRVIDCKIRRIINATGSCRYIAFSYLWGKEVSKVPAFLSATDQPALPDDCPRVINDSIDVALKLGYQYLWVDRYCINQSDIDEKKLQISQMDRIYINAQITIIAVAGNGPSYGLPGINSKERKEQPSLRIGERIFVSSLPRPRWYIRNSRWATRGWTYQEGFLSKRRFIFTDEQVCYECNTMACSDVLWQPLDAMHCKIKLQSTKRELRSGILGGAFSQKIPGSIPIDIMSHLSDFSQRDLTYPYDALNAFEGIFQLFAKAPQPVYHLAGIPMLPPTHIRKSKEKFWRNRNPTDSFIMGLSWFRRRPGKRRPEFPSWSWTGWEGQIEDTLFWSGFWDSVDTHIKVFLLEQTYVRQVEFPKNFEELPKFLKMYSSTKILHITASAFPSKLIYIDRSKDLSEEEQGLKWTPAFDGYYIKLQLGKRETFPFIPVYLDGPGTKLLGKTIQCIMFIDPPGQTYMGTAHHFLLVQKMGNYYERVGCAAFHEGYVRNAEGLWIGKTNWVVDGPTVDDAKKLDFYMA